jgi:hypothetical protein
LEILDRTIFNRLIEPGPRLPWITRWLLDEVWSRKRYQNNQPIDFLCQGEERVNKLEILIASAAPRTYEEFFSRTNPSKRLLKELVDSHTAIVIFDGLSLREVPIVLNHAEKSGFSITKTGAAYAAIPSETIDFIERELPCGRISPSQLSVRKEIKEKGIAVIYSGNYNQSLSGEYEGLPLLVWSSFPDMTYRDSGAKFENHFENIHLLFETAWINTVQQIKGKKKIIITSDHGYIFFGTGMDFPRSASELKELNSYFGNDRNASIIEKPNPPQGDDILIDTSRNVALVKGRIKTRSTGDAAAKLYKHGGLSLMEMFVPWVVLEPR